MHRAEQLKYARQAAKDYKELLTLDPGNRVYSRSLDKYLKRIRDYEAEERREKK